MRKPIRYGGPESRDREASRSRKAMSRQIDELRAEVERLREARDRLVQLAGRWRVEAAGQPHSHTGQSFAAAIDVCADELLDALEADHG